jgi:hypothetical protein
MSTTPSAKRARKGPAPATLATATVPATPEQGGEIAGDLQNKRTSPGTKGTYGSKVKKAIEWFAAHRPNCLNTQRSEFVLPIPCKELKEFFGHLCSAAHKREQLKSAEEITEDMEDPSSSSTIVGYRSAILDLYTTAKMDMDAQTKLELKMLLDGYDKLLTTLKRKGLMKISEGKRPISGSGYSMLSEKFMKRTPPQRASRNEVAGSWATASFGWAFFVIMWNLMSRADSVQNVMLQHINWEGDALVITEQGGKADQKGEHNYGKHIFANPLQPAMCPILSLAVLIFSGPHHAPNGRQQLFAGTDSKGRFAHLLQEMISGLTDEEIRLLGCEVEDVGMHSERKGSSTYCLGQIGGPTPISVFLRMGQSLGQLKDRYIFFGEGADQLCGRMVCGLPFSDEEFGTLPPHYSHETLAQLSDQFWNEIVSGYDNFPSSFKNAFPFLLASLFHHEQYLRANLGAGHPLWTSRVFTHNEHIEMLRSSTLLGIGACKVTGLRATGIPTHLAIAAKVSELTREVEQLRSMFAKTMDKITAVLPDAVAAAVSNELRKNFTVEGVAPLTIRDIDARLSTHHQDIRGMIEQVLEAHRVATLPPPAPAPPAAQDKENWWKEWDWVPYDGVIKHWVPQDWSFPTLCTAKTLWDLWYFGDKSRGIRPYRLLEPRVEVRDPDKMKYSRATTVLRALSNIMRELHPPPAVVPVVGRLSLTDSDKLFHELYKVLLERIYPAGTKLDRKDETTYGNVYKLLVAHGLVGHKRTRAQT